MDLNKACPKGNFPTPFINHIIDECAGIDIFSFMDDFSGYNHITIRPEDQHKTNFISPWGTFVYKKKFLLALKMLELLFSVPCPMLSMISNISSNLIWMT